MTVARNVAGGFLDDGPNIAGREDNACWGFADDVVHGGVAIGGGCLGVAHGGGGDGERWGGGG